MSGPVAGNRLHVDYDTLSSCINTINSAISDFQQSAISYNNTQGNTQGSWLGMAANAFFQALGDNNVIGNNGQAMNMAQTLANDLAQIMASADQADDQAAALFKNLGA
jgi:hypothetical protein